MKIVGIRPFNVQDPRHGGMSKPGKLFERNKEFVVYGKQPDSMLGDVCDFNSGMVLAMSGGFHPSAPK